MSDEVYYKRDKSEEWYGPAKVILIEGKVITVKHGGVTVKVNTVSLVKIPHICTPECELKDSGNKKNESLMPENQVSDAQNRWDRNKSIITKEVANDNVESLVLDNETDSSWSGNKDTISKGMTGDTHRKGRQGLPIMNQGNNQNTFLGPHPMDRGPPPNRQSYHWPDNFGWDPRFPRPEWQYYGQYYGPPQGRYY